MHYAEEHDSPSLKQLGYRSRNLYTAYLSKAAGYVTDEELCKMDLNERDRDFSDQITTKDHHLAELLGCGQDVVGRIVSQFFANTHEFAQVFMTKALPEAVTGSVMINVLKTPP